MVAKEEAIRGSLPFLHLLYGCVKTVMLETECIRPRKAHVLYYSIDNYPVAVKDATVCSQAIVTYLAVIVW